MCFKCSCLYIFFCVYEKQTDGGQKTTRLINLTLFLVFIHIAEVQIQLGREKVFFYCYCSRVLLMRTYKTTTEHLPTNVMESILDIVER